MSKEKKKKKAEEAGVAKASGRQAATAGTVRAPAPRRSTLASLHEEIDRLFNEFAQGFPRFDDVWNIDLPRLDVGRFAPATDLVENNGDYRLSVELPGMGDEDVEVDVDGGMLTVKGEKEETKESGDERHISERRYGYFRRSLRLPDDVDADKISATLDKGVLRVVMPKGAKARKGPRRIEVE